jgi:hypothetical protein
VALFEYAVYSGADPNKMLKQMEDSGLEAGKMAIKFREEKKYKEGFLPATAGGGMVTGVGGGIAKINPAPKEGLASVGVGERIMPAGKGGGGAPNIVINVNGIGGSDLGNFLKDKISQGIYEYKRREKFN